MKLAGTKLAIASDIERAHEPAQRREVHPIAVTQKTVFDLVGWSEDLFLDNVRAWSLPHVRRGAKGKLVTVRVDVLLAAIEAHEDVAANDQGDDDSLLRALVAATKRR